MVKGGSPRRQLLVPGGVESAAIESTKTTTWRSILMLNRD